MLRPVVATLALVALSLALPKLAAAEETMCGLRGSPESSVQITALPMFGLFSLTPAAEMTAIRWVQLDAAGVLRELRSAGPDAAVRDSLLEATEILWCATADDPRCSPLDTGSGSTAQLVFVSALFTLPSGAPAIAASPVTTLRDASERAQLRRGVTRSLDRPPR
jgi:hypothetical protein